MRFSRRWLGDYVELPADVAEVAERLTFAGFTVEGVERLGAPADPADPADDEVLDIDVTTNRPDCMNHLGLARELAVLYGRPLVAPTAVRAAAAPEAAAGEAGAAGRVDVEVEEPAVCPRFVARVVTGLRVGPSPAWLVARLQAIGLRSVNNVVDVTNFVLWETGQPIHAYDLDRLRGGRLTVRLARQGETLTTLDGTRRELAPGMLLIADGERGERPVGLGGVMGGQDTEVWEGTRAVVIEAAHFDRTAVRLTAKRLALHTDASHRFERGVDLEGCRSAADRVAALLVEIAGGEAVPGAVDRREPPPAPRRGRLSLSRLGAFAGVRMDAADVVRWFRGLGFAPRELPAAETAGAAIPTDVVWEMTVPSWRWFDFDPRPDGAVYEADLFEEAVRIHGFEAIPAALPALPGSDGPRTERQEVRDRVRRFLSGAGYAEAINFGFEDPAAAARLPTLRPGAVPLALANPLSERHAAMRRSLLANLLENADFNQRRGAAAVRLFEVASVFYAREPTVAAPGPLPPDEEEHLALVCGGRVGLPWDREEELDFFDLKGVVEALAGALGVAFTFRPGAATGLLAGSTAELLDAAGRPAGLLGRLDAVEAYPLYVCELVLASLEGGSRPQVELPPRVPGIGVDLTLTHRREVTWQEIAAAITAARPADLLDVALKARYEGEGVPAGAVNTTIAFHYNAGDRSLTQAEVNERQQALSSELVRRFGPA